MAQGVEQLLQRFAQLDKPDSLGKSVVTAYQLNDDECGAAFALACAEASASSRQVAEHAFLALALRGEPLWLSRLLANAEPSLLARMQDSIVTYALPYFDAPLVAEFEQIIADTSLSEQRRLYGAELLQQFAILHPEYYGRIVKVLGTQLQGHTENPPRVNAQLVASCIALQAEELMPVIGVAYQQGSIDSELYPTLQSAQTAMHEPETAFESGLEAFMHTRELDEIRLQLENQFATVTELRGITTVMALDGFLHALSLSPLPVARSVWLNEVDGLLSTVDEQALDILVETLTTYYAEVKDALQANMPLLYLQREETADSQVSRAWAEGFLLGYALFAADPLVEQRRGHASAELISSMKALGADGALPAQYENLGHGDVSMIVQLMLLRAFAELHGDESLTDTDDDDLDDSLDDFFAGFATDPDDS